MCHDLLSRRGLSLERLRTLVELERAGSLAKVAPDSPTRQTLYSRQLKELSECFGVPLVQRQGRELKLTAEGCRLAMLARETFGGLTDFDKACANQPLSVRVGGGDSLLQWLLLPSLGEIQKRQPDVNFHLCNLRTEAIVDGLLDASLDLGLLREDAVPPALKSARLCMLDYAIFVPRSLLPRGKTPTYQEVLERVSFVAHTEKGQLILRLHQLAEQEKLRLTFRATCESFPQACRAVLSGNYAAVLPGIAMVDLDDKRFLRVEWPALRKETRTICLAWRPQLLRLRPTLER